MGLNIINAVTICCLVGSFSNIVTGYPSEMDNDLQFMEQPQEMMGAGGLLDAFAKPNNQFLPKPIPNSMNFNSILTLGMDVLKQFQGVLPYLMKTLQPILAVVIKVFLEGQKIFLQLLRSLPPGTLTNIQKMFIDVIGKFINADTIKSVLKRSAKMLL